MTYAFEELWNTLSVSASPFLSILFIPLIIKYIENNYWSNLADKKNVWKQYLGKNRHINDCSKEYYSIENTTSLQYKFLLLVFVLMTVFFLAEILIILSISSFIYWWVVPTFIDYQLNNYYNLTSNNVFLVTTMIIAVVFTYFPLNLVSKIEKNIDFTEDNIKKQYFDIKWYNYNTVMFPVIQLWILITVLIEGKGEVKTLAIIGFLIPLSLGILSISYYNKHKTNVKKHINNRFSRRFPILEITTMGAGKHIGKIKNIFNHDSIILVNNDTEIVILWDAVATIKEYNDYKKNQRKLSNFTIDKLNLRRST